MTQEETDHIGDTNKMVTAVDLMFQRAISVLPMGAIDARHRLKETYYEAKAMEKEQIINGWDNGFLDYQISMHEDAEQYYNETYRDK
jgi:hypothetical protein